MTEYYELRRLLSDHHRARTDQIRQLFARIVTDSRDQIPHSQVTAMVAEFFGTSALDVGMRVGIMNCACDLVGGEPEWRPKLGIPYEGL
jgi:hypothetical protein